MLKPGALAAIVVPAAPTLYDYYDRMLGHERRYAHGELPRKARAAGLEVVRDAHLGWTLYPAFWAKKKLNRRRHPNPSPSELEQLVAGDIATTERSRIGFAATALERRALGRGLRAPFGIPRLGRAAAPALGCFVIPETAASPDHKWPKRLPVLTAEQERVRDDFMATGTRSCRTATA